MLKKANFELNEATLRCMRLQNSLLTLSALNRGAALEEDPSPPVDLKSIQLECLLEETIRNLEVLARLPLRR
jgi:hypothetical protein